MRRRQRSPRRGTLADLGSGWRTATLSKGTLSLSGDNILGEAGYWVFGGNAKTQKPNFFTAVTASGSVYGGNGGYISIDNPVTTPGASPSTLVTGTLNPFVGGWNTDFSFILTGIVPSLIRIGLMVDNLDIAGYNPSGLQVLQTNGSAAGPQVATCVRPQRWVPHQGHRVKAKRTRQAPPAKGRRPLDPIHLSGRITDLQLEARDLACGGGRSPSILSSRARSCRYRRIDGLRRKQDRCFQLKVADPAAEWSGFKGPAALCRRSLDCLACLHTIALGDARRH